MPQGLTLEQLKAMGAVPTGQAQPQKRGYTREELSARGAVVSRPQTRIAQPEAAPLQEGLGMKAVKAIGDFGIGAVKGLASTSLGALDIADKYAVNPALKAIGKKPVSTTITQQTVAPKGAAQKVGFGAEQLAELMTPTGLEKKAAVFLLKATEKSPALARGLAKLLPKMAGGAAEFGGKTALQTGGDAEATRNAALLGGAFPVAGAALKPVGKVLAKEPERLMGKALGFTKAKIAQLDDLATQNKTYKGIKDFALKHGFQGSREQMGQQIQEKFTELTQHKPEILAAITKQIKNTFENAFKHLKSAYGVLGQEETLAEIEALSKKKTLTATELDKVRALIDNSLPTGAYKGAEPVRTEGLQNLVNPIRRILENLDESGTIKKVNQDIRILYKMMDAIEHSKAGSVEGTALFRGALRTVAGGGAAAVGLPAGITVPAVLYGATTDFPQVASFLAQHAKGLTPKIPPGLPKLIESALVEFVQSNSPQAQSQR